MPLGMCSVSRVPRDCLVHGVGMHMALTLSHQHMINELTAMTLLNTV